MGTSGVGGGTGEAERFGHGLPSPNLMSKRQWARIKDFYAELRCNLPESSFGQSCGRGVDWAGMHFCLGCAHYFNPRGAQYVHLY